MKVKKWRQNVRFRVNYFFKVYSHWQWFAAQSKQKSFIFNETWRFEATWAAATIAEAAKVSKVQLHANDHQRHGSEDREPCVIHLRHFNQACAKFWIIYIWVYIYTRYHTVFHIPQFLNEEQRQWQSISQWEHTEKSQQVCCSRNFLSQRLIGKGYSVITVFLFRPHCLTFINCGHNYIIQKII